MRKPLVRLLAIFLLAANLRAGAPPEPFGLFVPGATGGWTVRKPAAPGALGPMLAKLKVPPKAAKAIETGFGAADGMAEAQRWSFGVFPDLLVLRASSAQKGRAFAAVLERQGKAWKLRQLYEDEGDHDQQAWFPASLSGHRYLVSETGAGGKDLMLRRLSFFDLDGVDGAPVLRLLSYHGTLDGPNGYAWRVTRIGGSDSDPGVISVSATLSYDGVGEGGPVLTKYYTFSAPLGAKAGVQGEKEGWAWMPEPLKGYLSTGGPKLAVLYGDAQILGARIKNGDKPMARWVRKLLRDIQDPAERKDPVIMELQRLVDSVDEAGR